MMGRAFYYPISLFSNVVNNMPKEQATTVAVEQEIEEEENMVEEEEEGESIPRKKIKTDSSSATVKVNSTLVYRVKTS